MALTFAWVQHIPTLAGEGRLLFLLGALDRHGRAARGDQPIVLQHPSTCSNVRVLNKQGFRNGFPK